MSDYPPSIAEVNHQAPVPRRVRAMLGTRVVLDTARARYLWEQPHYPQYYIPIEDFATDLLVDEQHEQKLSRGTSRTFGLQVGDLTRPGALRVYTDDALPGLSGLARVEWDAVDAWFEEDEQVFVHPRNPYTRVDALRSSRRIEVTLDGRLLADSTAPVLVFETGLPTRYYVERTSVRFDVLRPSDTETACPYKGVTSKYWSAHIGATVHADIAWTYHFPTAALLPIAGLIAFYNEKVDIAVDGRHLPRPSTHFS